MKWLNFYIKYRFKVYNFVEIQNYMTKKTFDNFKFDFLQGLKPQILILTRKINGLIKIFYPKITLATVNTALKVPWALTKYS